jgi:[protein-PII] uridylyltransferase
MPANFSILARHLNELRQIFRQKCHDDVPGLLAARTYAQNFLEKFREAFAAPDFSKKDWAVIAVGGFGRGDLSFASDLDLLFLHQQRLPPPLKESIRDLTYVLWDNGFELGHVTASVSAVKKLIQEDFSVLTTYLETRFIGGDGEFYQGWCDALRAHFGPRHHRRFLQSLAAYHQKRLQHYGESSYLLEPHLKEGVGGLRDLHVIGWATKFYFGNMGTGSLVEHDLLTREEVHWLEQARDFLWRVRLQLHQLTGKRQDQLLFPEQEQIAARLGFLDSPQGVAVEAFMRLYYRHTARIRRTTAFFLERLEERHTSTRGLLRRVRRRIVPGPFLLDGRHLHFLDPDLVAKYPRLLMQFFWQAAGSNAHFHHQTGQVIRQNCEAFSEPERHDPEVAKQFFDILLNPYQAFRVLKVMLETGFLQTYIPEFAGVRYRVQHDVYHLYTVDEHLLRTVRQLHEMEQKPEDAIIRLGIENAFAQLENRRVLYLAALIHDIGKSRGKNHSATGAQMSREIARRLHLTTRETDLLSTLIENHLLLADTAMKRDLGDEKPVLSCALPIADRERLRLLYLLTIADSCATGPGAWNTWKASLLRELYLKVDHILLRGFWTGEDVQERIQEIRAQVLNLAVDGDLRERMANWFGTLSFRYVLSQAPQAIFQHYLMEQQLEQSVVVLKAEPSEGEMWQLTVATRDRPGLFSIITGVLWAYGLNILSADIFTRQSGIAMDVLLVECVPDLLHVRELWEKVQADLGRVFGGDAAHFDQLLAGRRGPSLLMRKSVPRKEDRVLINEDASDFYTVVEVYTWDRPGLLHTISKVLYEADVSIQLAKISTPGAQVADVFYVTDLHGNKLLDPNLHAVLRQRLLDRLAAHE